MAAVPITIVGIATKDDGTSGNVTIVGMASLTGVGVGGGPIQPPSVWPPPGKPEHPIVLPPEQPPSIWPSPGHPAHPIAPGGPPPGIWPPPGRPAHPIVLPPDKPTDPPTEPPTNPEDPNWVWGWSPSQGWHPVFTPGPGGKPQPVPPPGGGNGGSGTPPPTDPNAPQVNPLT